MCVLEYKFVCLCICLRDQQERFGFGYVCGTGGIFWWHDWAERALSNDIFPPTGTPLSKEAEKKVF